MPFGLPIATDLPPERPPIERRVDSGSTTAPKEQALGDLAEPRVGTRAFGGSSDFGVIEHLEQEEVPATATRPGRTADALDDRFHPDVEVEPAVIGAEPIRRFAVQVQVRSVDENPALDGSIFPASEDILDEED